MQAKAIEIVIDLITAIRDNPDSCLNESRAKLALEVLARLNFSPL